MTDTCADILDRCIEEARSGGDPERILAEHPEEAGQIRPLLRLARELEGLPRPQTSPSGWARVLVRSEAQRQPERPVVRTLSRPVLLRVAAVVLVLFAAGWGVTNASAGTAPGDLLYPIKRATEKVQYFLTLNGEQKAELRLIFSEKRLAEAVKNQSRGEGVDTKLLDEMLDEAKLGLQEGSGVPEDDRAVLVSQATHLARHQHAMLEQIKERAPASRQAQVEPYIERCRNRCAWMDQAPSQTAEPAAPGRSSQPQEPPARRARRWDRWMRRCPW